MGDQVLITSTLSENASLQDTVRWLKAFADTVQSASGRNLIQNVNTSGAALSSIKNAKANQFPYFTGPSSVALATLQTVVNVLDFGADPTGVADSTTGIQNAINAIPVGGGIVYFPAGNYKLLSLPTIGNGSTSGQSTVAGVYLVGAGDTQGGTTIFYAGSAAPTSAMFTFLGPMKGWGVRNLLLNGNSLLGSGVKLIAASDGEMDHVGFVNFTGQNYVATSLTSAASGNANCQFNRHNDLAFFLGNFANTAALFLDGNGTNANTNSNFMKFENVSIVFPNVATAMDGVYCRDCDSIKFDSLVLFGGGAGTRAIVTDYSGSGAGIWPANCTFDMYDPDGLTAAATKYANVGSPAANARPSRFYAVADTNGATYPKIANTSYTPEVVNPGVSLTGQTASIGSTNINGGVYVTGMYRFSVYLVVTATGAGGATVSATLGWIDDSGVTQTKSTAALATNAKNYDVIDIAVRITSGNIPVFLTNVTGAMGTAQYAIFIKMEKLD